MSQEIYAIYDSQKGEFWYSGNNRAAYSKPGIAKTAFASSGLNPLRCKFSEQSRFKLLAFKFEDGKLIS